MHCDGKLCGYGLYVDDVLVVSQDKNLLEHVMSRLNERFNFKNLGEAKKRLDVWIERNPSGIILHQQQTIEELLEKFGMGHCRPSTTPVGVNHPFFEDDVEPFTDTNMVREAIGSLLWVSNCTRPDITTAVNCLSRFVAHPTVIHWRGIKRVLRHLKGTVSHRLSYKFGNRPGTPLHATTYADSNWAGDSKSAKSTSGAVLESHYRLRKLSRLLHVHLFKTATVIHWRGIKRVLRHLKGTVSHRLSYKFGNRPGTPLHATTYADSNWAGDSKSAKSTSGKLNDNFLGIMKTNDSLTIDYGS
ncbi:Gag-pol Polyprotein [Phytophthora megakarya]|uniref:Gag-pol Polyprotein n=1 Tax=Phytophthora megakarya TaxID=4795 RepID=A0A225WHX1_9STRA|nr:Gag-pol Polyprotein [Phytophthora megakarya]